MKPDEDPHVKKTTISLSVETRDALRELGKMGDTYEDVIRRLIEFYRQNTGGGRE